MLSATSTLLTDVSADKTDQRPNEAKLHAQDPLSETACLGRWLSAVRLCGHRALDGRLKLGFFRAGFARPSAAEVVGVPKVHATRTIAEDLLTEPKEQREPNPSVRQPGENVAPRSLGDKKHEKVGAEVHRREPALRHDK
jgi:hypothetical protein